MGYEFMGEIAKKGLEIAKFKIGDLIISPFTISYSMYFYCA